ncbi:hypothetical protein [Streptomyces sp. Caat 7-52]|uniref:hypothetical protein n=1 Tax=Streptomyces sp. Caat 7-52 TaxID=2949637 RepID=UPI002036445C|nr:hypothetical protein [Streptomyces sp. Caat 7-52]
MTGAVPRLGIATAVAAVLLGAGAAPAAGNGSLVTVIDNSQIGTDNSERDAIVEIDRTGNAQTGSGTAGSDHDGSAVDVVEALFPAARHEEE